MKYIALTEEILACRRCEEDFRSGLNPGFSHAARPVFQIHPKAKILIAGQAPGIKVHESGIPFDDASGNRLRTWLGVSAEQFYNPQLFAIVPMAFCYPGKGKSGDLPPPKICAELWRKKVLATLPNIQLTLLIGAYAQKYHLPEHKEGLTELLLAWNKDPRALGDLLPLPHPSPRNNIWLKKHAWFEQSCLPLIKTRVQALL